MLIGKALSAVSIVAHNIFVVITSGLEDQVFVLRKVMLEGENKKSNYL